MSIGKRKIRPYPSLKKGEKVKNEDWPDVVQGGMGVAVSNWRLAKAVAEAGGIGTVSGTALDAVFVRRLWDGVDAVEIRRAMEHFPNLELVEKVLRRYHREPQPLNKAYPVAGRWLYPLDQETLEVSCLAGFVEVFLAKEGHTGRVAINFLEKIQLPTLPILYGALLAGVDGVVVGAGIPKAYPKLVKELAEGKAVEIPLAVEGRKPDEKYPIRFDPRWVLSGEVPLRSKPFFFAVVSSSVLAAALLRGEDVPDGFIVEGPSAGGHNAPPRSKNERNSEGEPLYGSKDEVDPHSLERLGKPFWLAGGFGFFGAVKEARKQGAAGVQVGTLFAYCRESGLTQALKRAVWRALNRNEVKVYCDPDASPTGYPFQVVRLPGTLGDPAVVRRRARSCDLGYLRAFFRKPDGGIGFRCPAEPEKLYRKKGGTGETQGKLCLCNGLLSAIGFAKQRAGGFLEPPLLTAGKALQRVLDLWRDEKIGYSAKDVMNYLRGESAWAAV